MISGYINIHAEGASRRRKTISSKSEWFDGRIIITIDEFSIRFTKPTLDYTGKTYPVKDVTAKGWRAISIPCDIPVGKHFEFDEDESTEDEIVVYFDEE